MKNSHRTALSCGVITLGLVSVIGCGPVDDGSGPEEDVGIASDGLSSSELSTLVLGGAYPVSQGYKPAGGTSGHAGIDFGGTGDGVTNVSSPVNGTITANTSACGKVAIFDGANTIIMAHMTGRTALPVGSPVTVGTYLGRASMVLGGGCSATGPHLHMEIRTGNNSTMASPVNNNTMTTMNPLSYTYGAFPPVKLLSPANNAPVAMNPVSFTWAPIQGATSYRLQISPSNSFDANTCLAGCTYNQPLGGTSQAVNLPAGKTYYWRVRAGNASTGQGGYFSPPRAVVK